MKIGGSLGNNMGLGQQNIGLGQQKKSTKALVAPGERGQEEGEEMGRPSQKIDVHKGEGEDWWIDGQGKDRQWSGGMIMIMI